MPALFDTHVFNGSKRLYQGIRNRTTNIRFLLVVHCLGWLIHMLVKNYGILLLFLLKNNNLKSGRQPSQDISHTLRFLRLNPPVRARD